MLNLEDLPPEIFTAILGYVPAVHLCKLSSTNRFFHRVIADTLNKRVRSVLSEYGRGGEGYILVLEAVLPSMTNNNDPFQRPTVKSTDAIPLRFESYAASSLERIASTSHMQNLSAIPKYSNDLMLSFQPVDSDPLPNISLSPDPMDAILNAQMGFDLVRPTSEPANKPNAPVRLRDSFNVCRGHARLYPRDWPRVKNGTLQTMWIENADNTAGAVYSVIEKGKALHDVYENNAPSIDDEDVTADAFLADHTPTIAQAVEYPSYVLQVCQARIHAGILLAAKEKYDSRSSQFFVWRGEQQGDVGIMNI